MAVPMSQDHPAPRVLTTAEQAIAIWLWCVIGLVFVMIVVGGATRLTDSGLSITEWRPILGAIPPLSHDDWLVAFEKYREIPEYRLVNHGMSLDEFKVIFWWEWAHRFLGRIIGIAFGLPLAVFWLRGWLARGLALKLLGILALGGLQGAIGWYMVQSGLVDRVDVSQYRLALHLTVAFVILASLVWVVSSLGDQRAERRGSPVQQADRPVAWIAGAIVAVVLAQVVLGAFVAGLKAGLVYNSWPLMNGQWIPDGLMALEPWYLNAFENVTAVQFNHRMMAYLVVALGLAHVIQVWRSASSALPSALLVAAAIFAQAAVGVWTLLAQVPLSLGLVHQGGAAIVLGLAVWHLRRCLSPAT